MKYIVILMLGLICNVYAEVLVVNVEIKEGDNNENYFVVNGINYNSDAIIKYLKEIKNPRDGIWLRLHSSKAVKTSVLVSLLQAADDNEQRITVQSYQVTPLQ